MQSIKIYLKNWIVINHYNFLIYYSSLNNHSTARGKPLYQFTISLYPALSVAKQCPYMYLVHLSIFCFVTLFFLSVFTYLSQNIGWSSWSESGGQQASRYGPHFDSLLVYSYIRHSKRGTQPLALFSLSSPARSNTNLQKYIIHFGNRI